MLLDNRQPVEGLQIMTSTKNFPNSFPANVSDVDQYRPGSCRRSGLVSRFPIRDFMQLDIKDRAPQTTLEMQVRFYNEKNFQRNEKFYKKKRILPKNPKIYGNTSKSDHALSEMLGKEGIMRVQTFQKPDPFSSDSESDDDSCLTDVI